MSDIFRYFLGIGVIILLVVFYAWIKTFSEFKEAK
jgi:flagellar biogenesis protein FliO